MRKLLPLVLVLFACNVFGESKEIADLRKRAEAGDIRAQQVLGRFYSKGDRVLKDGKEAVKWYCKAGGSGLLLAFVGISDFRPPADAVFYQSKLR